MSRPVLAFGVLLILAATALPARAADVVISDEARSHFTAGVTFLQDPDGARYEEALREFQAAYAISPSWKILGNLGLAAMKLERDGEARDAIKRYLSEGGNQIEAEERVQMERDLQSIEASMVTIHLEATPAGVTIIDERQPLTGNAVVNRYGPLQGPIDIGVRAGQHKLTAKLEGYADQVWKLDGKPRSSGSHTFALQPLGSAPAAATAPVATSGSKVEVDAPASSGNGMRTASYVVLGVGAIGLGVGTVFALQAKGHYDEANELCPGSPCQLYQAQADRRTRLGKDGDRKKTVSLIGFIAGGVGVATGVTLFVLGRKPREGAQTSAFIGLDSVGVRGSF